MMSTSRLKVCRHLQETESIGAGVVVAGDQWPASLMTFTSSLKVSQHLQETESVVAGVVAAGIVIRSIMARWVLNPADQFGPGWRPMAVVNVAGVDVAGVLSPTPRSHGGGRIKSSSPQKPSSARSEPMKVWLADFGNPALSRRGLIAAWPLVA
jgi:hypothetical protein